MLRSSRHRLGMTSPIIPASNNVTYIRPFECRPMQRAPAAGRRDRIFADHGAVGAHAADLVGGIGGEPEIAFRPDADPAQEESGVVTLCSVMAPSRSMRPSELVEVCTNQIEPSGWVVIARGWLSWLGIGNSVTTPSMVMRPTRLPAASENHMRAVALRDRERPGARRNAFGEFGDLAVRRDAADPAYVGFGEPHIAVRADERAVRARIRGRKIEQGDVAAAW